MDKEIEDTVENNIPCSCIRKMTIIKMFILPKAINKQCQGN